MKPWMFPVLLVGLIFTIVIAIPLAASAVGSPQNTSTDSTTTVNLPTYYVNSSNYAMKISAPAGSTFELISPIPSVATKDGSKLATNGIGFTDLITPINGSQYSVSVTHDLSNNRSVLLFTPINGTGYSVNVVSLANTSSGNYIWVQTYNPNAKIAFTSLKNITWTGDITLNLNVTTTLSKPAASWDFFFGFTGIHSNFNVTGTEWSLGFLGIALICLAVGYLKHSRIKILGIVLMIAIALGYLGVGLVLLIFGTYILGLILINVYWRLRKH